MYFGQEGNLYRQTSDDEELIGGIGKVSSVGFGADMSVRMLHRK
jgi:hypothetical protein